MTKKTRELEEKIKQLAVNKVFVDISGCNIYAKGNQFLRMQSLTLPMVLPFTILYNMTGGATRRYQGYNGVVDTFDYIQNIPEFGHNYSTSKFASPAHYKWHIAALDFNSPLIDFSLCQIILDNGTSQKVALKSNLYNFIASNLGSEIDLHWLNDLNAPDYDTNPQSNPSSQINYNKVVVQKPGHSQENVWAINESSDNYWICKSASIR